MAKKLYEYPFSCIVQMLLCKVGIAIHNPFRDECTPDFECCSPLEKKKYWLRISREKLPIRKEITYTPVINKKTGNRTFKKISRIYIFNHLIKKYGKVL